MTPLDSRTLKWSALCRDLARADGAVRWAWAATRDQNGAWRVAHFAVRAPAEAARLRLRYPDAALGVEQLTPRAAAHRLRAGSVLPKATLGVRLEFDVPQGNVHASWLTTEHDGVILHKNAWPELFVTVPAGGAAYPPTGPLHAPGQRVFPHWTAALGEVVFERPIEPRAGSRPPAGAIRLADGRARLADLAFAPETVIATVDAGNDDLRKWVLRATWRPVADDPRWRSADLEITGGGETPIAVGTVPYEMIVLLVDDRGKVVDRRGWEGGSIQPVEDEPTLLAHVERWRHEGESDTVEFKRALDDPKPRQRFAESVAAFANTASGAVLVGVGDDGGIAGYDPPKAKDKLARIIADSVDEPPETTIARLEVEGSPVWVVQVPVSPSAARPHAVRGRVLVRAHATNRPATAREIREMSTDPQSAADVGWLLR